MREYNSIEKSLIIQDRILSISPKATIDSIGSPYVSALIMAESYFKSASPIDYDHIAQTIEENENDEECAKKLNLSQLTVEALRAGVHEIPKTATGIPDALVSYVYKALVTKHSSEIVAGLFNINKEVVDNFCVSLGLSKKGSGEKMLLRNLYPDAWAAVCVGKELEQSESTIATTSGLPVEVVHALNLEYLAQKKGDKSATVTHAAGAAAYFIPGVGTAASVAINVIAEPLSKVAAKKAIKKTIKKDAKKMAKKVQPVAVNLETSQEGANA